jgi:hypothetical protein
MYHKRKIERVNTRSILNLCSDCYSIVNIDQKGNRTCSGDRLVEWQAQADLFQKMSEQEKEIFLKSLGNSSGFLRLLNTTTGKIICGYSSKLYPTLVSSQLRIPDPMAAGRMEKKLRRPLKETELEEGYLFDDNYQLPFINYPEDV